MIVYYDNKPFVSKMATAGTCITIGALFDLFYDTKEQEIQNPKYQQPHPSCEHYNTVDDIKGDVFCPKCGKKTEIITYTKTLVQMCYTTNAKYKTYFSANEFIEASNSKEEIVYDMLKKIKYSGSEYDDTHMHLRVNYKNVGQIYIDADANKFLWFSRSYRECGCFHSFEKSVLGGKIPFEELLSRKIYLICYVLEESSIKILKNCMARMNLFEKLGLQTKFLHIDEHDHQCGRY